MGLKEAVVAAARHRQAMVLAALVTTFAGVALFIDRPHGTVLEWLVAPFVAFGLKWLDYDNDGWLDLVLANGHVQDNIAEIDGRTTYRQRTQLFRNRRAIFAGRGHHGPSRGELPCRIPPNSGAI